MMESLVCIGLSLIPGWRHNKDSFYTLNFLIVSFFHIIFENNLLIYMYKEVEI